MRFFQLVVGLSLLACVDAMAEQPACEPSGDLKFVCGPKKPEDMVQVPGTKWILTGSMAEGPNFYLIDSQDASYSPLEFSVQHDKAFANCPTPPSPQTLLTNGMNIRAGASGHATLSVIGHGARYAVEIFDVDSTGVKPTVTWKGCVTLPVGLKGNSVASFSDGSLIVTVPLMYGTSLADALAKRNTGGVFKWSPGQPSFELVRGTELPGNNGIEVAADGSKFYVVSVGLGTVVAFSNTNPAQKLGSTRVLPFVPDNMHMGANGKLVTGGMKVDEPECGGAPGPDHNWKMLISCPRGTMAAAIDPATMADTIIVDVPRTPAFNNVATVITVGDTFWASPAFHNRIAYGKLAPAAK